MEQKTKFSEIIPKTSVPVRHVDERSDQQIVEALSNPTPVISERNVWAFWDTGFTSMRAWSQRNVIGWVRMLGPEWTVRVLNRVEGSSAHYLNFVQKKHLPDCLVKGTMKGRFSGQHSSDMIRMPCLYEHGGVWLDVGILLFMHLDDVCWSRLEDSGTNYEVALASADPSLMSGLAENFFVAARRGNGFIRRWMDIFLEAWKDRSDCLGIHSHPLFRGLVNDQNIAGFFQLASGDKLDYFGAYLAYERLRLLEDPDDGFSGPNYCKNRVLLLEYREFASAAMRTHNDGQEQFDYLKTSYDKDTDSKAYRDALSFCEYMLTETAMMKLYHWKEGSVVTLADLWDKPENEQADKTPGTFAEYLRYVSSHYTQERKLMPVRFPPLKEEVIVAGVIEYDDEDE